MNKTDKACADDKNHPFHSFTALQGSEFSDGPKKAKSNDKFQPLFRYPSSNGRFARSDKTNGDQKEAPAENLEQIRQKSYQRGKEDGRQDACRIAKDNLSPGLQDFIQAMNCLSEYQQQVSKLTARQVLQLALVITEQVLETSSHLSMDDLDGVRSCIEDAINQDHQLKLTFNPQDLETLNQIMSCEGLAWPRDPAIQIQSDDNLPCGVLDDEGIRQEPTSLEDQATRCFAELIVID